MLEIIKTVIVDKSFFFNGLSTKGDEIYLSYVLKAHLVENNEIYLEGRDMTGKVNLNSISDQRETIQSNLSDHIELSRSSGEYKEFWEEGARKCEEALSSLNNIEKTLDKYIE